MKFIKNLIEKYCGKLQYVATSISVDGEVNKQTIDSLESLNRFVSDINNEKYWMIQKIEKIRIFKFSFNENVIHKPLFFYLEDICEKRIADETKKIEFSYLKKDKSLTNVNYIK